MSHRSAALAVLISRLSSITIANGYSTDAGATLVTAERPDLGPDDPDEGINMLVRASTPTRNGDAIFERLPVDVQVLAKANLDDPLATVEAVLADVKTAVEQDHDLNGTLPDQGLERGPTRPLDREPGSTTVGVEVSYFLDCREKWGAP